MRYTCDTWTCTLAVCANRHYISHKGCICDNGFTGDYCEYISGTEPVNRKISITATIISFAVVGLCILVSGSLFFNMRRRWKRKVKETEETVVSISKSSIVWCTIFPRNYSCLELLKRKTFDTLLFVIKILFRLLKYNRMCVNMKKILSSTYTRFASSKREK